MCNDTNEWKPRQKHNSVSVYVEMETQRNSNVCMVTTNKQYVMICPLLKLLQLSVVLTVCRTCRALRMASCSWVKDTSPTGIINGEDSLCTGTARALCNTENEYENVWNSDGSVIANSFCLDLPPVGRRKTLLRLSMKTNMKSMVN